MSTDLDRRLRAALHDAADLPAPDFAPAAALAGARRRRRRNLAGLVATVAVIAAAAVTIPAVALRREAPATPAAPTFRYAVSSYRVDLPAPGEDPPQVYDAAAGRYVTGPWDRVQPSPTGRIAVVYTARPEAVGVVPIDRLADRTAVRWVLREPLGSFVARWSPDGRHVLYQLSTGLSSARVAVLDVETLQVRRLTVRFGRGMDGGVVGVGPGGAGFAVFSVHSGAGPDWVTTVQLTDERGVPTRRFDVPGMIDDFVSHPFSPDGRRVVTALRGGVSVVELASGSVVGKVTDRAAPNAVQWYDDRLLVMNAPGARLRLVTVDGRVVSECRLPGRYVGPATVSRLDGPAPPGAIVL